MFFWTQYFGGSLNGQIFMVVQDTQTGAVLAQLPTDDNFQQNYQYETITEIPPSLVSAINAGGDTQGAYVADINYSDGASYSSSNTVDISGITNPSPQAVYQTVRYGNTFEYPIPNLTAKSAY